jgi:hypothetical protein
MGNKKAPGVVPRGFLLLGIKLDFSVGFKPTNSHDRDNADL